jgi:hypothetical protein
MQRPDANQTASSIRQMDSSQQPAPFGHNGYELQEPPPWGSSIPAYGGATGSGSERNKQSLRARSVERGMQGYGFAGQGSAVIPQSPVDVVQAFGDNGNSIRGLRTNVPAKQMPPMASAVGFAPGGPTPMTSAGGQWYSMTGREIGGASRQPVSTHRLPVPQPVGTAPQVHTRANIASTPTTTARSPAGVGASSYMLPHSNSGRLATMSSMMVTPQQQQLGFGSTTFGASPRSTIFT